jgi:hypothetical protein
VAIRPQRDGRFGVPSGDGLLNRTLTLIDLPSGARTKIRVPDGFSHLDGPDERGRVAYLEVLLRPFSFKREGHRLVCLDLASGARTSVLELDPEPRSLRLAPRGDQLLLWRRGSAELERIELASGARHALTHELGKVLDAHWRPDGEAFTLVGELGSATVPIATLVPGPRHAEPRGPYTSDGSAQLVARDDGFVLVEAESGATRLEPALFPYALGAGSARIDAPTNPHGLTGPHHGLYSALPSQDGPQPWSMARGGNLWQEDGVLALVDLVTGARMTLAPEEGHRNVRCCPVRLPPALFE